MVFLAAQERASLSTISNGGLQGLRGRLVLGQKLRFCLGRGVCNRM